MLLHIKDTFTPTIVIISPDDGSYCAKTVSVSGTVTDSSTEEGTAGEVRALSYEILSTDLSGEIPFEADGWFSFDFETTSLGSIFVLRLTAEDWNRNTGEASITLRILEGNDIPSFSVVPGNRYVTVTWNEVPNTVSYTLYYEKADILPSLEYSKTIPDCTSPYTITGLKNGDMHTFKLRAHAGTGEDNWSDVEKAIPLSPAHLSPMITPGYNSLKIEWNDLVGVDSYAVYKTSSLNGSPTNISGSITGTSFTDSSVIRGQNYFYAVKPVEYCDVVSNLNYGKTGFFRTREERHISNINTPGSAYDAAVKDSYAYIADQTRGVRIIDISDISAPKEVHSLSSGYAQGVTVEGTSLYLADGSGGVKIFDVTKPAAAQEAGSLGLGGGQAKEIAVRGSYAYIANGTEGLRVIDVSDPQNPKNPDGTVTGIDTEGVAMGIELHVVTENEVYAYVADGAEGVRVIDISDPENPANPGGSPKKFSTGGSANDIAIKGSYAYVAIGPAGFRIIDISTPDSPTDPEGSPVIIDTDGAGSAVIVNGPFAYVADGTYGVQIIDISDPTAPAIADTFDTADSAEGLAVRDSYLFVADKNNGLSIKDIRIPAAPAISEGDNIDTQAYGVHVFGDYVYVAAGIQGLCVYSLTNPGSPSSTGSVGTTNANDVVIRGTYAYVADYSSGLRVFDVSDPSNPADPGGVECVYDTPGYALAVALYGAYALVADRSSGLRVIDISDVSAMEEVGYVTTSSWTYDVTVQGTYAYIADGASGLRVIDISDPENPFETGQFDTTGAVQYPTQGVAVRGSYAYIADSDGGLVVIDISDPTNPGNPGGGDTVDVPTADLAGKVEVVGSYAYVTNRSNGMIVFDISDPTAPFEIGQVDTAPNNAVDLTVDGSYAYVTDDAGFRAVDLWPLD